MNWDLTITDEDIDGIERQLGGRRFDEERRAVLRCLDSCDVQACAGSGKTTTLVAKLAILAGKLPSDYRGICVLSHTNAARIELEGALRSRAHGLFHYPHFIGTIQSFVDRFLAIPAMLEKYGIRPCAIEDTSFGRVMIRRYEQVPRGKRYFIDTQKRGTDMAQQIRYCFDDADAICVYDQGKETSLCGRDKPTYGLVLGLKEAVTGAGYIGYHDAYALANWYLKKYPEIADVISYRFPFVFVDEMQDTDNYQSQILDRLLRKSSVVQCFGDRNQTIYGSDSANAESGWQPENALPINSSYRFGKSMAKLCQNVCVYPRDLVGRQDRIECDHTIFLFDADCVVEVIPAFADRIEAEGLDVGPFKAVGAVGKSREELDRLSIATYWPAFKKRRPSSASQESLKAYFQLAHRELVQVGNCGAARGYLIEGLCQVLRHHGDGPHTPASFLRSARALGEPFYSTFLDQIFVWCDSLVTAGLPPWNDVREATQSLLHSLLGVHPNARAVAFIDAAVDAVQQASPEATNTYTRGHIRVEIDTIHGVKGQNHVATLVLETYLRRVFDLQRLLPFIKGKSPRPDGPSRGRLPLIHVGMTRPSHLLSLAIRRDHVQHEDEEELTVAGWSIQDLTL